MRHLAFFLTVMLWFQPGWASAQDRRITLAVGAELADSGAMGFILPRFSLKHGIKVDLASAGATGVDVVWAARLPEPAANSDAVMQIGSTIFFVTPTHEVAPDSPRALQVDRFIGWLLSDIGQRTILSYERDGTQIFTAAPVVTVAVAPLVLPGDAVVGEALAFTKCGRCHVIGQKNRMKGLGSSPSFALLRTFDDWQGRFERFFTLNPHPAFTQITDVTAPFNPRRPPPIHPLEITLEDLEAILAFVATIEPADLGAPIIHQ